MAIMVQKFGGSSVGSPERMRRVARRIAEAADAGNQVAVVVSAMGDTTDDLIALSRELNPRPSRREMDMLLSTGEQQSIALLAMTLQNMGYDAISLTGRQAGFHTDGAYATAKILSIDTGRVREELDAGRIVIVAGFQGVDSRGEINTLGRGGSDTSAVALAIGLNADVCEIFTDVDGVYTADPRIVKKAWKMPEVSYDEMLEMAAMGALVLQPRSVELAKQYGVKLHVRSSFNHNEGTIVKEEANMNKDMEKELIVCGVAHDMNVLKVTLFGVPDRPGVAGDIFSQLSRLGVNVDMIVQSGSRDMRQDISFTCGRDDRAKVESIMQSIVRQLPAENYTVVDTVAKISVVGAGMITHPGVAATMFKVFSENKVNIWMISTSEIKISCIIDEDEVTKALLSLHTAFGLDDENA
ncbi:MAG: aspartate kinase [Firmicutes bacterium]|nr:aspartate kinase [Bacillota bacterium]